MKMQSDHNVKIMLLFLLLMLINTILACKNSENQAEGNNNKVNFYNGIEITPVYSSSYVEKSHSRYVFDPVLQGDIVKHDFIIKNDSKEVLELSDAEGCCGCVVESYTRKIQPGLSGQISALLLTDSRGGKEINGTIRAHTNDKDRPAITIDISCYVKEFAALHPYRIWLNGSPKEDIVEKCIVIPNENYPFNITGIKTRKGVWFEYSYKEIEKDGRKAYEITVKNKRKKPGPYQDVLFVQTDNSARPEFKIRIEGRIAE
jgi:hypothetical protein